MFAKIDSDQSGQIDMAEMKAAVSVYVCVCALCMHDSELDGNDRHG
jgi:hypothetical protein